MIRCGGDSAARFSEFMSALNAKSDFILQCSIIVNTTTYKMDMRTRNIAQSNLTSRHFAQQQQRHKRIRADECETGIE